MRILLAILIILNVLPTQAQEFVVPLQNNPIQIGKETSIRSNKKRASLPFLDDFSYNSTQPDPSLWKDQQVFINNTMSNTPITKGVATFDGLNEYGRPYRPDNFNASGYGDSLTSQTINLAGNSPADSLYLSFFFQPQGNGFAPETKDSLSLFFRNASDTWILVWQSAGTTLKDFKQVLLPINNPQYFHDSFQFRFVNFTSLNSNDDVWNLDYVRLDAGRNQHDTLINDIGFTTPATSILSTYSSMPYRHFKANQANEVSAQQIVSLYNGYNITQNIVLNHKATELFSSSPISSTTMGGLNMIPLSSGNSTNPSYSISYTPSSNFNPVTIRNTYYFSSVSGIDKRSNDTLIQDAIFDNYFAYDDGSVELSYFLSAALNQPAKTALQFTLNEPDTVRGLSVYFAAQVPSALNKFFSIVLYDSLGAVSAGDVILKQQDLYQVQYAPGKNEFSQYAFDQPVALPAGTYYIGITQPANFGSDSIYYGLDVNTNTNINKLSYNVNGYWFNSSTQGSIMMHPLVGPAFVPTDVANVLKASDIVVYPNPTKDKLFIKQAEQVKSFALYSMDGKKIKEGLLGGNYIDITDLTSAYYIIELNLVNQNKLTTKIWKQ